MNFPYGRRLAHRREMKDMPLMSYGNPERELTGNFIADHWAGRHSLARSYWINGVIIAGFGGALLVALISIVIAWGDLSLQLSAAIGIAAFALGIAIWVWSAVGIWRSAGYHTGQGGSGVWAALARIIVLLGGFATFGQLGSGPINRIPISAGM